ncbi:Uncharacterised protein [Mycobacteroides abscessus subsp. abscessus]|nr:Uncharacterised protein [Mycobacteroides abscessus subsp. abscessus]
MVSARRVTQAEKAATCISRVPVGVMDPYPYMPFIAASSAGVGTNDELVMARSSTAGAPVKMRDRKLTAQSAAHG